MPPSPKDHLRGPRLRPRRVAAGLAINLVGVAVLTSHVFAPLWFGAG